MLGQTKSIPLFLAAYLMSDKKHFVETFYLSIGRRFLFLRNIQSITIANSVFPDYGTMAQRDTQGPE